MYSASFIFEPGTYDEEFYRLDKQIQDIANSIVGFIGREAWVSEDGKKQNSIYYWQNKESLKEFSNHPKHIEAKKQYTRWYKGFHIVIAKVEKTYGDGNINHLTPNNNRSK